jgi:hypothetical protein
MLTALNPSPYSPKTTLNPTVLNPNQALHPLQPLELKIPFPGAAPSAAANVDKAGGGVPNLSSLRRLAQVRMLGWRLDKCKFSKAPGERYCDWQDEARTPLHTWCSADNNHVCVNACVRVWICACVYVCVYICMYACCTYLSACTCISKCARMSLRHVHLHG